MSQAQSNPWKVATIAIVTSVFAALASGVVVARVHDAKQEATAVEIEEIAVEETVATPAPAPVVAAAPAPAARPVENCDRYLTKTNTDGGRVVKNGLIGGALGAGLGAAGGAIGGSAGKGAGIGALAGAAVSTGYTLHDEHKQKQAARSAYDACLARNGR